MRFPRIRITIRQMMIVVLAVGLACGWLVQRTPLEQAREQDTVTTDVMHGPATVAGGRGGGSSRVAFYKTPAGQVRWSRTYRGWRDSVRAGLFDVEVYGGGDGTGLAPITIRDYGATRNARLIRSLASAYRERGWRYVIVPSKRE
jgi:hypothetical protein